MDFEYLNYLEAFSGDRINTENYTQEIQITGKHTT